MSGGKGGGGGFDAGAMLEYGQKALDLQDKVYEEGKDFASPWYQAGSSAIGDLMMRMGLGGEGSTSPQARGALIDQYRDQFTSTTGGGGDMAIGPDGKVYDLNDTNMNSGRSILNYKNQGEYYKFDPNQLWDDVLNNKINKDYVFSLDGWSPLNQSQSTTDMAGLNEYVDNLIANQEGAAESNPLFGSLMEGFSADKFEADPGYQFRLDEGTKALERAAAARGQYFDPSTMAALAERNASMADQTYNQAYDRYNIDQNNIFNRLASVSGMGQTATGQMIGAGQNYANQAGNIYGQMGNAVTSAQVANASQPSMFDSLLGAGVQLGGAYLGNPFSFA